MRFPGLVMGVLLLTSLSAFAQGRAPAVEDFVGIEVDQPDTSPQGKGSLYNLEQDLQKLEVVEAKAKPQPTHNKVHKMEDSSQFLALNPTNILAMAILFILPLMSWFAAVSHLKKKATVESASNVEVLEKYRRERELARKRAEEIKKAS